MASTRHFKYSAGRILATGALAVAVAGMSFAPNAYAATSDEIQAQLDSARSQLEASYAQAEQAGYDLITVTNDLQATNDKISQTEAEISDKQQELDKVQGQLSEIMATQYKGGNSNLASILLGSNSVDDLISRVYYANKVSESQQEVVSEAKDLKGQLEQQRAQLEQQKSDQEQLVQDQQAKKDAADQASAAAESYYNGLDQQLKDQLAAEEEAARQAAEAQAAQQAQEQGDAEDVPAPEGSTSFPSVSENSTPSQNTEESSSSRPSSNENSVPSGGVISRAQAALGSGYSWTGYRWTGSPSSSVFTCSGLVDFAYGYGPWSHTPESYYGLVKGAGNLTQDVGSLQPGDLVFFTYAGRYPGHVGIYVGGGQMIDSCPGGGVQYRSVYQSGFMGGGSL